MGILHGRIRSINHQLIRAFFRVRLIDQNRNLSENVRIYDCANQVCNNEVNEFAHVTRAQLIAANHKHRVVDANKVNVPLVFLAHILFPELFSAVIVVVRGQPSDNV